MANSVDPDETARYEPSHLDPHFLQMVSVLACRAEMVKPCLRLADLLQQVSLLWLMIL